MAERASAAATASIPSPRVQSLVRAARDAAARSPAHGLQLLQGLREAATRVADLPLRLAVDEAECRVLGDVDNGRAVAVADAGLARVADPPPDAARETWLRLRACRAGVLNERGERQRSLAELEVLLTLAPVQRPSPARAMVLLERGVIRSRTGELEAGQQDLIAACAAFETLDDPHDRHLCLGHLANHYKRVGEPDEALHLLQRLSEDARGSGATYDLGIYTFAMAQVMQLQLRWADSLDVFREASSANAQLGDPLGVSYAEHGLAQSLLRLGRAAEALPHADQALKVLDRDTDPRYHNEASISRAEVLSALGRTAEALLLLDGVEATVRQRQDVPMRVSWLDARAAALAGQARWREAYLARDEARPLQVQLHAQRLSEQSARRRMQFNRARDAEELSALRRLNEQGQELRHTQAVALGLFVVLLAGVLGLAMLKVRQARRLQTLASTDELTGVANRRALMASAEQELGQARAHGRPLALLMIDVDHFKRINDTHGHPVGDAVLRHLTGLLGAALRERDRLGRIGGEEFAVVLPGASQEAARGVAERMRAAVAATALGSGGLSVSYSISVGVAEVAGADGLKELIAKADQALYRAKGSGRNRVVAHEPALDEAVVAA